MTRGFFVTNRHRFVTKKARMFKNCSVETCGVSELSSEPDR